MLLVRVWVVWFDLIDISWLVELCIISNGMVSEGRWVGKCCEVVSSVVLVLVGILLWNTSGLVL